MQLSEERKKDVEEEIQWLDSHPEEDKDVYEERKTRISAWMQEDLTKPSAADTTTATDVPVNDVKIDEVD